MAYADGYCGTAQGSIPGLKQGKMAMGKGSVRKRGTGKPVTLRSLTGASVRHGGHTGHYSNHPGPFAGAPHAGHHTGGRVAGHAMNGGGFQTGAYAASPHAGHHARSTGYKDNEYAAAGPQQGFVTAAKGNFRAAGPGKM